MLIWAVDVRQGQVYLTSAQVQYPDLYPGVKLVPSAMWYRETLFFYFFCNGRKINILSEEMFFFPLSATHWTQSGLHFTFLNLYDKSTVCHEREDSRCGYSRVLLAAVFVLRTSDSRARGMGKCEAVTCAVLIMISRPAWEDVVASSLPVWRERSSSTHHSTEMRRS